MENIGIMTWSLSGGGAERAVANLSRDLSEKYNVYIFCFDTSVISYPYAGKIINVGIGVGNNSYQKVKIAFSRIKKIRALKKKYNLKAMISFMPQLNIYNILTRTREKVIISIRNNMTEKQLSKLGNALLWWTGKKADITISLSEGVRQDLIDNFSFKADKVRTIYNSCDLNWFFKQDKSIDDLIEKYDFSKPSLVTVGRLTHQKGQWHLLRAFSLIKKQVPNCQLFIFGQGDLSDNLSIYAKKLGIEEDVHFMGYVKNHHKLMQLCDVFIFPSLFEGLGNVLLEALACGMPVVSTDCLSGPREILSDNMQQSINTIEYADYGILIPPFSKKKFDIDDMNFEKSDSLLAKAVIKLLNDPTLMEQYKKKALRRADYFAPKSITDQWSNVIEEKK